MKTTENTENEEGKAKPAKTADARSPFNLASGAAVAGLLMFAASPAFADSFAVDVNPFYGGAIGYLIGAVYGLAIAYRKSCESCEDWIFHVGMPIVGGSALGTLAGFCLMVGGMFGGDVIDSSITNPLVPNYTCAQDLGNKTLNTMKQIKEKLPLGAVDISDNNFTPAQLENLVKLNESMQTIEEYDDAGLRLESVTYKTKVLAAAAYHGTKAIGTLAKSFNVSLDQKQKNTLQDIMDRANMINKLTGAGVPITVCPAL